MRLRRRCVANLSPIIAPRVVGQGRAGQVRLHPVEAGQVRRAAAASADIAAASPSPSCSWGASVSLGAGGSGAIRGGEVRGLGCGPLSRHHSRRKGKRKQQQQRPSGTPGWVGGGAGGGDKAKTRPTAAVKDHSRNEPAGGWRAKGLSTKAQRARRVAPRDTDSGFNVAGHATVAHTVQPTSHGSR